MREEKLILKIINKRYVRETFYITGVHEPGGCTMCKKYKEGSTTCPLCIKALDMIRNIYQHHQCLVVPKRFYKQVT